MVKIIGLCGSIGAGKGEVNNYLQEKYGYKQVTVGDVAREETRKKGLEPDRYNTDKVAKEFLAKDILYFMKMIAKKIENEKIERVLIDGIRLLTDTEFFKKRFGKDYILIMVDALEKLRFERLKNRGRTGDPKTLSDFRQQEKDQDEKFGVKKTFSMADAKVNNNFNTKEPLYKEVDKLKKKYPEWF